MKFSVKMWVLTIALLAQSYALGSPCIFTEIKPQEARLRSFKKCNFIAICRLDTKVSESIGIPFKKWELIEVINEIQQRHEGNDRLVNFWTSTREQNLFGKMQGLYSAQSNLLINFINNVAHNMYIYGGPGVGVGMKFHY